MRKLLAILLFSLMSGTACACEAPLSVAVSGYVFERDQPVQITITNHCARRVRFSASLEVQEDGKDWVDWPFHINGDPPEYIEPPYTLNAHDSMVLVFDIRKDVLPPLPVGEKVAESLNFRFKVTSLWDAMGGGRVESTSTPFAIVDPFNALPKEH